MNCAKLGWIYLLILEAVTLASNADTRAFIPVKDSLLASWMPALEALNGGFDGQLLLTLDGAQIQSAAELQHEPVLLDAGFGTAVADAGCNGLPPFIGAVFAPPTARRSLGRCAVVGSGAGGIERGFGSQIDKHDTVVRINAAPTAGHERAVGGQTHIRVGNSDPTLRSALHEDSLFTVMQENSLWPWQQQAHYCSHNRLCRKHNCTCAEFSGEFMRYATAVVSSRAGEPVNWSSDKPPASAPSSGLVAVLAMAHLCTEVNIFGFGLCLSDVARGWGSWMPQNKDKNSNGKYAWLCEYFNRTNWQAPTGLYTLPTQMKTGHKFEVEHGLLDQMHRCGLIRKHV